jgi:hypothetical protein
MGHRIGLTPIRQLRIDVVDDVSWWLPGWRVEPGGQSQLIVGCSHNGRRDRLHWRIFDAVPLLLLI